MSRQEADQYIKDWYGGIREELIEEYEVMRKKDSDRYQDMRCLTNPPRSQQTVTSSVKSGNIPDPPPPPIDPDYSPGHSGSQTYSPTHPDPVDPSPTPPQNLDPVDPNPRGSQIQGITTYPPTPIPNLHQAQIQWIPKPPRS
ncbi:hypothetical protein BTVI_45257 [Pitangus sulphuratus]|nr:hypothetical protein BTVI_45257 [Pitangus sulphuratus]